MNQGGFGRPFSFLFQMIQDDHTEARRSHGQLDKARSWSILEEVLATNNEKASRPARRAERWEFMDGILLRAALPAYPSWKPSAAGN